MNDFLVDMLTNPYTWYFNLESFLQPYRILCHCICNMFKMLGADTRSNNAGCGNYCLWIKSLDTVAAQLDEK